MPLRSSVRARWQLFRERLRPDAERPTRVWLKKHWPYLSALALAITGVVALNAWLITCGFNGCPSNADIRSFRPPEGGRILDREGRLIGRLSSIRRVNVALSKVPEHVRHAFLATEDRRFYEHNGLDWRGLVRASFRNVASFGVREGFSTITMQVARNTFIDQHF